MPLFKIRFRVVGAIVAFFTLVMLGIFWFAIQIPDTSPPTSTQIQQETGLENIAVLQAETYVKAALVSPSTADFPFLDFKSEYLGSGRYRVYSYVDSQNAFGATVRTDWTATLKYTGGTSADINNWELEELFIDGKLIYSK